MANFTGATTDLTKRIKTHFFLICPNNSGSTFLIRAIAASRHFWHLKREGQNSFGYVGPQTLGSDFPLIWGAKQEWIDLFQNPDGYNWPRTTQAWYFQAQSSNEDAAIFTTKSPPFLLITDQLAQNFENPKFAFMVRDPYATIEGICRRRSKNHPNRTVALEIASRHMVTCFQYQKRNIENHAHMSVQFSYEEMCADPAACEAKLTKLLPMVDDLNLNQKISVKGMYDEPLRNMNEQQIERLSADDFRIINQTLGQHAKLIESFGYALRDQ